MACAKLPAMDDQFIARAAADLQRLMDEDAHLAATERGIAERRAALKRIILSAHEAIAYYANTMNLDSGDVIKVLTEGMPRGQTAADSDATVIDVKSEAVTPVTGTKVATTGDLMETLMKESGRDLSMNEICDFLVEQGRYPSTKKAYPPAYATAIRDPRFKRTAPGRFGLSDPGRPTPMARKALAESWEGDSAQVIKTVLFPPVPDEASSI